MSNNPLPPANPPIPKFPKGSIITNIHNGKGNRANIVYASIVGPDGILHVSATLDYCCDAIHERGIED